VKEEPLGILGGTFDPVHYGHLRLAEEVGERVGLAQVHLIPASVPPHRAAPNVTAAHRLEMVRLAIAGNPRLRLDDRECRRQGASYTVDTLAELRVELGPARPICLLMGLDAYLLLDTWSRWQQLFGLAHVVVAHRPGFELAAATLSGNLARETASRRTENAGELRVEPAGKLFATDITPLDISATVIRAALRGAHSVRYLLPYTVLDYIGRNRLYKEIDAG
jgi:nicotinate-nucleotide adenylyltransferase